MLSGGGGILKHDGVVHQTIMDETKRKKKKR
jgi:hypothetical protein